MNDQLAGILEVLLMLIVSDIDILRAARESLATIVGSWSEMYCAFRFIATKRALMYS